MDLAKAYRDLQLNPNNTQQVAAFEALSWKHLFQHVTLDWLEQAQIGTLALSRIDQIGEGCDKRTVQTYDDTLESVTYEFIKAYADTIWPLAQRKRSHLALRTDFQLKAEKLQMRARKDLLEKLARDRNVLVTEQMTVVESKLGRRVREFLMQLIWTKNVPLHNDYIAEELVQVVFLGAIPAVDVYLDYSGTTSGYCPCLEDGCGMAFSASEALVAHQNLDHASVAPPAPLVDLAHEDNVFSFNPSATSDWVPTHSLDRQIMFTDPVRSRITAERYPCPFEGCGKVYAYSESLATHQNLAHPAVLEAAPLVDLAQLINTAPLIDPDLEEYYSNLELPELTGWDDVQEGEQSYVGLLCPHAGCKERFPDWATFDAHAQLPHDGDGNGDDEMRNRNDAEDSHRLLRFSVMLTPMSNGVEVLRARVRDECLRVGFDFDALYRWRNLFGERLYGCCIV